jgi:NAD(P)-dependent dehydrogenase (short-subunit alcohol dehydrogenase family)
LVSAANGALVALARALAVELKPIRVNVLSPGWVDTPIWSDIASDDVKQRMFQEMAELLPVGRIGQPEDIAQAAVLLLTNGYMSGSVLHIEGGRRLV